MSKPAPLHISPKLALPIETVTGTIAVFGRKRTGKTYKAKIIAEEMMTSNQQIVIIDPTDAWWGLQSSADGASEGYPITIFGGRHGNLPLEPTAGEELADAIADDNFSAIFSLKGMSRANEQRFCYSFLERLYRKNPQKPIHIFMDEADIYAPQQPQGDDARTLGATQNIVRRGGVDGIGMTLITQRPASLSKGVVSQCDTMISLCLSHPTDLKQVEDWSLANIEDRSFTKQLMVEIPQLGRPENKGIAWVLNPDNDILKRVQFRELATFDSSRTPKVGEKRKVPRKLSKIDLEHLGQRMAATVENAKANDPKLLKQTIAELRAELAKKPVPIAVKDPSKHKPKPVVTDRQLQTMERMQATAEKVSGWFDGNADKLVEAAETLRASASAFQNASTLFRHAIMDATKPIQVHTFTPMPATTIAAINRGTVPAMLPRTNGHNHQTKPEGVSRMASTILGLLAQHPDGLTKKQIRIHTSYRASGALSRCYADLVRDGLVEGGAGSLVITRAGIAKAGDVTPLPKGHGLYLQLVGEDSKLSTMERRILVLARQAWPKQTTKAAIREATGYAASGALSRAYAYLVGCSYLARGSTPASLILSSELVDS